MPSDFWFRLSTYLSLALSCVCLGYAERELLPEVTAFAAGVVGLLAASFFLDRRFEIGLGKANLLGLGIGVAAALWMVFHVTSPRTTGAMAELDWPTNMLPVIAPVLMVLIPAKLLRPKHVGDWWAMHGVALAGVGLASAMEEDGVFVALLSGYAVCTAWSLVLFFYRRNSGVIPPVPNRPAPPAPQILTADPAGLSPRWLFARSTVWLALAAVVALPLFFASPRSGGSPWGFAKRKYEVGQQKEERLDLNKTGELVVNDEVAYKLTVTDQHGLPAADLPVEQAWRARALTEYTRGSWSRGTNVPTILPYEPGPRDLRPTAPAELGPAGFVIDFDPGEKERFPVLASPVWWAPNKSPVHWRYTGAVWSRASDGAFIGLTPSPTLTAYRQACRPAADDGLGCPFELRGPPDTLPLIKIWSELPRVREYAADLLDRLIRTGKLPKGRSNDPARVRTDPKHHERIARAFCNHFSEADDFTYTTTLRRQDAKADPVEDFLLNTRAGNCELYATALVLLLRSIDVPAQYVTGYKGWDTDEDGNLVIRRRHAHAWVEVLVSRPPDGFKIQAPQVPGQPPPVVWQWLTLDPTTGTVDPTATAPKNWLEQSVGFINDFIIGYDKEKRKRTIAEALRVGALVGPFTLLTVAVAVCGRWVHRRWRRNRLAARLAEFPGPDWYARYLVLVAHIGLRPGDGETPREFAERAADTLRTNHPAATDVPAFVSSKLYRLRYAGVPLAADEQALLTSALDRLEQTVSTSPKRAAS